MIGKEADKSSDQGNPILRRNGLTIRFTLVAAAALAALAACTPHMDTEKDGAMSTTGTMPSPAPAPVPAPEPVPEPVPVPDTSPATYIPETDVC